MPLISIVIATRNAATTLGRCLDSLDAQSFRDFEAIVVDGASGDGTVALLEQRAKTLAYWVSEPDSGVYGAWNKALARARGDWIAFLGADDWLADDGVLAALAPSLRTAYPDSRVVYGRVRLVGAGEEVLEEMGRPWPAVREQFRRQPCVPHPGLMHHRSLFEAHGTFDETLSLAADYELLLRELKDRDALFVPVVTVVMRHGGMSMRPENFHRLLAETRAALARHGLKPPAVLWAYWTACAWAYARLRPLLGDAVLSRLADLYRRATLREPRYAPRRR